MAARTILHKFLKVYFPELPDKPDDQSVHSFLPLEHWEKHGYVSLVGPKHKINFLQHIRLQLRTLPR
jgi:hypothetical protein